MSARIPLLEELELGIDEVEVEGADATEASTVLDCIEDALADMDEPDELPPEEPEPFCAETQQLHARIAARQTEEFFSTCIGTRRERPRVEPGGLWSNTSYSRSPTDGRWLQRKYAVGGNVMEM